MADEQINMMMSVLPGTMTGFAALNSGLVSINNAFLHMTKAFDNQFGLVNTILATTGVVVAQLGMEAMDAFGKFEQGMKIVQMVSGQTKAEIEQLSQTANQFSVQYRVDIDQITEGLQTLGRAGLNSASEQTEVLQNGLNTAKLEGRDLNGVLQELIQNTALLGGNLKSSEFGEQSQYVNDLLVATSMTAPITTHDVSETLKYSGGIAAAAGANIETEKGKAILEDYMGAIAAFAQKGVTGSIAGTALRAFFNKPATQDSSVTDALASIKLKPEYLWEEDEDTMKPVSEQIGIITKQMDKLDVSTMDRLQIWSKIVGGKMGQQMMKLDSDSIKDITKDIQAADDASNLAANSMKTYEANVKALGESGEVFKRNVGEKLVFFANPILEFLNKIVQFGNQDFMGWPIAMTIIGFVGMLIHKVRGAISVIRSEIGTLMQSLRAGEKYFLGKTGKVVGPNGEIIDKKSDYKSETKDSTKSEVKAPTTLAAYAKQYSKTMADNSALTLKAFEKAGVSAEKIALAGHLSSLTKRTSLGIPEGQVWATALKNGVLTDEEVKTLHKGYSLGLTSRQTANLVDINEVIPRIKLLDQAMRDIGLTAQTQAEKIAAANKAYMATFGDKTGGKSPNWVKQMNEDLAKKSNAAYMATFGDKTGGKSSNWVQQMNNQAAAQTKNVEAMNAEANAAVNAATQTRAMAETVISEFNAMSLAVATTVAKMGPSAFSIYPNAATHWFGQIYGAKPLFQEGQKFLMDYYFPPGLYDEDFKKHFGIESGNPPVNPFAKGGMFYDETRGIYVSNYKDLNEGMGGIPQNSRGGFNPVIVGRYTLDENGHITNTPYAPGATNVPMLPPNSKPHTPAAGYQGQLPTSSAVDARIKENERIATEQETKAAQQHAAVTQEETAAINKSIVSKQAEIDRIDWDTKAFMENAAAVDRMTTSAAAFVAVMEGKWPNKPATGIWSPGLNDKQKSDLKEVHRQQDIRAGNNSDRRRFQEDRAKSNLITSRKDIDDIRNKSSKQWEQSRKPYTQVGERYYNPSREDLNYRSQVLNQLQKQQERIDLANNNKGLGQNTAANMAFARMFGGNVDIAKDPTQPIKSTFGATFRNSFSNYLNRDRSNRMLNFAALGANGKFANSLGGLANKTLNATDAIGGPFMIAIMAASTAIQMWQKAFQDYCEDLKESGNKLKEAYANLGSAEDSLEQAFREKYPDAEEDEIEQKILDVYASMNEDMANAINNGTEEWLKKTAQSAKQGETYEYDQEADDGSMKVKEPEIDDAVKLEDAIKENTGALYVATGELSSAMGQYVNKANDSWWGVDGWTGDLTNTFGDFQDNFTASFGESFNLFNTAWGHYDGSRFTDNGEFLLTASQKDENYAGYTEMAGLMLEDFKDARGDWKEGLRTMMGSDVDVLSNIISEDAKTMLQNLAGKDSEGKRIAGSLSTISPENNLRLQMSMKNDQKTWKSLAKEIAKQENKTGKKVSPKNMTKKIEGLIGKLNASMGSNFSDVQILQAAYLQQMQDMYQVAQNVIVPIINTNMQTAAQTLAQTTGIGQSSDSIDSSSGGTEGITSVIAGMVAQIAMAQAADATYNSILMQDPSKFKTTGEKEAYKLAQESSSGAEFMKKAAAASYSDGYTSINWDKLWGNLIPSGKAGKDTNKDLSEAIYGVGPNASKKAMNDILTTYGTGLRMTTYGEDSETARGKIEKAINDWRAAGSSSQAIYESLAHIAQDPQFRDQIKNAYLNSGDDEGTGSGGSGSGDGDKDKGDTGTRKERVDLVLCNRKTIPKLNVNLFKKPPSFTILNKNFKLRDVRINSEDKPKAIMAAIKNSFIDIQKRTDPKIIQDEDAVYDPAAATDGTNVPSGSAKTNTS